MRSYKMRAVLTGATGHVGSHLAAALSEQGHSVLAIVRPGSDLWRLEPILSRIEVLRSEMKDLTARLLAEFAPTVIFHLAWDGVTSDTRNAETLIVPNVENSLAAFRAAADAGCAAWIGVGSQAEYGKSDWVLREDSTCNPDSAYGVTKAAVRQVIQTLCGLNGIRFVWFRLFATYGPGDDSRHLIPSVIESFLCNQPPRLTAGEQIWDYLYVRDAAEALIAAAMNEKVEGVFNLATGAQVIISDLVNRIYALIRPDCPTGLGEVPYSEKQIMFLQADVTKWRAASGWSPAVNLESGLHRTVEWHRARRSLAS